MGGTGWEHVVEYSGSVAASLGALHREVFASSEFQYWSGETSDVAAAFEEFVALRAEGEPEGQTHSVLDVYEIARAADYEEDLRLERYYDKLYPLTEQEVLRVFGTGRPTLGDWERGKNNPEFGLLHQARFSGRCVVLFDGDAPAHLAVWGSSGY
jgi:hypothetical protein